MNTNKLIENSNDMFTTDKLTREKNLQEIKENSGPYYELKSRNIERGILHRMMLRLF